MRKFFCFITAILFGCATPQAPETTPEVPFGVVHLTPPPTLDLEKVLSVAQQLTASACVAQIGEAMGALAQSSVGPELPLPELKPGQSPRDFVNALFQARMKLKNKVNGFHRQGGVDWDCVRQVSRLSEVLRFLEDSVGAREFASHPLWIEPGKPQLVFMNSDLQLYSNQDVPDSLPFTAVNELKSGDLMLSEVPGRGVETAVVFKNSDDEISMVVQQPFTQVVPLRTWLNQSPARLVILRHVDEKSAAEAGRKAFAAAGGRPQAEWLETYYHPPSRQIASTGNPVFSGDVEKDPRFRQLAEWKRFARPAGFSIEQQFRRSEPEQSNTPSCYAPFELEAGSAALLELQKGRFFFSCQ